MQVGVKKLSQLPLRLTGPHTQTFKNISMITNHHRVQLPKNIQNIYIFRIKFTPTIPADNRELRKEIITSVMAQIQKNISNPVISGFSIYSITQPKFTQQQIKSQNYCVNLKQVKILQVAQNTYLLTTFLNNALRNVMGRLDYIQIGRSGKYFNLKDKISIDNLMMFNGFKSNFLLLENCIFLRVDSAKKVVRNQTVLEAINDFYRMHADKQRDEKRSLLQTQLSGRIVMSNYGKPRYYRIQEIVFAEIQTTYLQGEQTPISQYYHKKYQITIKNMRQPLIKVENKKTKITVLLVPELCLMTGIPENFDEFRRRKIGQHTIKDAKGKKNQIQQLMKQLKNTQQMQSLRNLGINIETQLTNIKGKIIPTPRVALGENKSIEQGRQSMFNLFDKPIYSSNHNIRCGLVHFSGIDTKNIIEIFNKTSNNLKIKFDLTKYNAGESNRNIVPVLQSIIQKCAKQQCNICLIVLPYNMKHHYKRLKLSCLLSSKIVCQVVIDSTLRKKNVQAIATKILLQMIAKRGNTLWVPICNYPIKNTMIGGFDGSKMGNGLSNISLCATLNSTFSSIFSKNSNYQSANDKFQLMLKMLMNAIDAYLHRNKQLPNECVIFLNGSSNDQISLYLEMLINPLRHKLDDSYANKAPKLNFTMVNVMTSQRFFISQGNNVRNVPAGTLVTEEVVSKYYDFYLVSQSNNRVSTLPNHYKVIYNDSEMEQAILQELIYSQCFNYANWTGSIKIPAILQYAKKCNKFATEVLESQQISQNLQNRLYFI